MLSSVRRTPLLFKYLAWRDRILRKIYCSKFGARSRNAIKMRREKLLLIHLKAPKKSCHATHPNEFGFPWWHIFVEDKMLIIVVLGH